MYVSPKSIVYIVHCNQGLLKFQGHLVKLSPLQICFHEGVNCNFRLGFAPLVFGGCHCMFCHFPPHTCIGHMSQYFFKSVTSIPIQGCTAKLGRFLAGSCRFMFKFPTLLVFWENSPALCNSFGVPKVVETLSSKMEQVQRNTIIELHHEGHSEIWSSWSTPKAQSMLLWRGTRPQDTTQGSPTRQGQTKSAHWGL